MEFVTVYESYSSNRIHILRGVFEQYGIQCRILKAPTDKVVPKGIRLQVEAGKTKRAYQLMKDNGFLGNRLQYSKEAAPGRFWIYLFLGLILVAAIAALVTIFL